MAKLAARLLATAALSGFESRHLSKIQNGRHKQRSGKHPLFKKRKKNNYLKKLVRHFFLNDSNFPMPGICRLGERNVTKEESSNRAGIFKEFWGARNPRRNRVIVPARQAGGIHSLESIPALHKRLKIRAQR